VLIVIPSLSLLSLRLTPPFFATPLSMYISRSLFFFLSHSLSLSLSPSYPSLTGTLVAKWEPDYRINTMSATDTAAQASLCTGIVRTTHVLHTQIPAFKLFLFVSLHSFPLFSIFSRPLVLLLSPLTFPLFFSPPLLSDFNLHGVAQSWQFHSFHLTSR
jgi:hypothetical protein